MLKKLISTSLLILSISGLVACGGSDRDEPFNPGISSSASSNQPTQGARIDNTVLLEHSDPLQPFGEGKQVIILREEDEFRLYYDAYSNEPYDASVVDFETGQVVLIDEGYVHKCNESLSFRSFGVFELSNNTAKITLNYRDHDRPTSSSSVSSSDWYQSSSSSNSSSSSLSDCTNDSPLIAKKRQFRFYFVNTRKTLVVEELVTY